MAPVAIVIGQGIFESFKKLSPSLSIKEHGCFLSESPGNEISPVVAMLRNDRDVSNGFGQEKNRFFWLKTVLLEWPESVAGFGSSRCQYVSNFNYLKRDFKIK